MERMEGRCVLNVFGRSNRRLLTACRVGITTVKSYCYSVNILWQVVGRQGPTKRSVSYLHSTSSRTLIQSTTESKFAPDAPNVVHMTVKPQEIIDEEDSKGGKGGYGRDRDSQERSPGCRCVIL